MCCLPPLSCSRISQPEPFGLEIASVHFGVLHNWKMAPIYCQAVLCHDQRIALDGAPAEAVDAEAKDLASKRLAQLAARKAAKKAAEAAAPAVVKVPSAN